jgi:hypothetical protein
MSLELAIAVVIIVADLAFLGTYGRRLRPRR